VHNTLCCTVTCCFSTGGPQKRGADAASTTPSAQLPKLLGQVRERIRTKHYSIRTEAQYVQWVRRFILYDGKRHPRDMGAPEVEAFLTHLSVEGGVAAATQNQAPSAPLFL